MIPWPVHSGTCGVSVATAQCAAARRTASSNAQQSHPHPLFVVLKLIDQVLANGRWRRSINADLTQRNQRVSSSHQGKGEQHISDLTSLIFLRVSSVSSVSSTALHTPHAKREAPHPHPPRRARRTCDDQKPGVSCCLAPACSTHSRQLASPWLSLTPKQRHERPVP